jgi:LacI family transcriptional regulator
MGLNRPDESSDPMASPPRRPTTITDVAKHAGVSVPTVSRVMNGNTKVAAALVERVRASAAELNYSASPLARSLVLGYTRTIAVVVPDLSNPTFQGALRGITRAAADEGYLVLIADTFENAANELAIATEARQKCDAVILCAPRMPDEQLERAMRDLSPVVVINRQPADPGIPVVSADYGSGIRQLLEHLHGLGHCRVSYLAGLPQSASNALRIGGIRSFVEVHPDFTVDTLECGVGFDEGFASAPDVLESGTTAVLAFNDLVAMGLLSALHERAVPVPGRLSVAGFDDIPLARFTTPPLTTARVPVESLGSEAWARLSSLLAATEAAESLRFDPELVIRGSTGPAPS